MTFVTIFAFYNAEFATPTLLFSDYIYNFNIVHTGAK